MKLEIRDAETRDLPEIKRLVDKYISQDYYSLEELEGMVCGERNLFYVVTDADREDIIVSYFYAFLAPLDEALKTLHEAYLPEQRLSRDCGFIPALGGRSRVLPLLQAGLLRLRRGVLSEETGRNGG